MSRDWFYQPPVNFIRRSHGFRIDLIRLSEWARSVTDACVEEKTKFNIISWDRRLGLVDHQKASCLKFGGPLSHPMIRAGVSPSPLIPQHDEYQYFKGDTSHPKCHLRVLLTQVLVEFSRAWDAGGKGCEGEVVANERRDLLQGPAQESGARPQAERPAGVHIACDGPPVHDMWDYWSLARNTARVHARRDDGLGGVTALRQASSS